MTKAKRLITGLAFTATIALTLLASGGDAYAKVKNGGGNQHNASGGTITITITVDQSNDTVIDLGITWE
jgi:hypothetical protein